MDPFSILTVGVKFNRNKKNSNNQVDNATNKLSQPCDSFDDQPSLKTARAIQCNTDPSYTSNGKRFKRKTADEIRDEHGIIVDGFDLPCPVESFTKLKLPSHIMENLIKSNYKQPTPVQMQVIPLMMAQHEVIACAPTGSGKTVAFLLPIIHQLKQSQSVGFRAIVLAPTRELAKQIHRECIWLSQGSNLRVHLIKNTNLAAKKFSSCSSLKYDILITTPQRLEYLLNQDPPAVNIEHLQWLVIDECDRLFELTFRDQLALIFNACNQSKEMVKHAFFSATYDANLEKWCKMNLDNVATVVVGGHNIVTDTIEQRLIFAGSETGKLIAIKELIMQGCPTPVLIFVSKITKANYLQRELLLMNVAVDAIHADRSQEHRDRIVREFRQGTIHFLICTELMGRGVDFKAVNLVINYDLPSSAVAYIHHIGRTGRAGRKGTAVTFYTHKDEVRLSPILNVMRRSGCQLPSHLLELDQKKALQPPQATNKKKKKFTGKKRVIKRRQKQQQTIAKRKRSTGGDSDK